MCTICLSGMENARPFFETRADQDAFYERLLEFVRPELDAQREARAKSEQPARHHWVL